MLVDAVDAQSVEHVERSHPLGVTLGQIVVDRYHVDAISCQGIKEHGEGSDERLTFTGSHLGNLSLVQHDAAEELYVVVYHFPLQVIAAGRPVVVVDGLVAVDGDEVLARVGSQFAVEVGGCDDGLLVLGKAAGGILDDGKHLRHHLVEGVLVDVKHFLLQFVNLCEDIGTLVDGRVLDGGLQLLYLFFLLVGGVLNLALQLLGALTELVVRELLHLRIYSLHLLDEGADELVVTRCLVAEQRA